MAGADIVIFTDANTKMYHVTPLGPYCISTVLQQHGFSVQVVDYFKNWLEDKESLDELLNCIIDTNTLFVGFSGLLFSKYGFDTSPVTTYKEYVKSSTMTAWPTDTIKEFVSQIKNKFPNIKFVYGGNRDELKFHEIDNVVDFIVKGHAENMVIDLANHLKNSKPIKYRPSLKTAKIIDYDYTASGFDFKHSQVLFDHIQPTQVLPIETSRGCMFKCDFCDYPLIGRKKGDIESHRNMLTLANEIKRNYDLFGTTKYIFIDNIFNESTDKIQDVLRARDISKVDINFYAYLRYEILNKYPEQIKLLKDLGLQSTMIGIESLNHKSAKAVSKGTHPEKVKDILYNLKDQWKDTVSIMGSFLIGLPGDTPDNLSWTEWLNSKDCPLDTFSMTSLHLDDTFSNISPMAKNPEKYGYIKYPNRRWKNQHWDFRAALAWTHSFMDAAFSSGRFKVGGFDILGMQGNGYTFDELKNLPYRDIDYKHTAGQMNQQWILYKNSLLNTLKGK